MKPNVVRKWQFRGDITMQSPEWIQKLYATNTLLIMYPPEEPPYLAIVRKYGMTPVEIGEHVAEIDREEDEIIRLESIRWSIKHFV